MEEESNEINVALKQQHIGKNAKRKAKLAAAAAATSGAASGSSSSSSVLKANPNRRMAGSNWNSAKNSTSESIEPENNETNAQPIKEQSPQKRKRTTLRDKYISMDCEMVGIGLKGQEDMLARVSIVNRNGKILLDKYVKARDTITDYRTAVSGIRPSDLINAEEFDAVQDEVVQILQNRILVGHNIRKDLQVLHIKHPYVNIRDTSSYKPLCRLVSNGRTPSLKRLSAAILGIEIQTGEHNSVEDARAAMSIYNRLAADWELYLQANHHRKRR